jgi:glyoxylase-like metal-dependent hydrolase (beta-lactamase superfamily II)
LLFQQDMIFDDAKHRVELRHFGVAHTRGDGFAWLPKEGILFTGDACVNGPYNYMGDGQTEQWVATLEAARKLAPKVICPGHGPMGGPEVLDNQIAYLKTLRAEVRKIAGKSPAEAKAAINGIKETLRKDDRLALYIGNMFDGQVEKIYVEMGGKGFQASNDNATDHWRDADARKLARREGR